MRKILLLILLVIIVIVGFFPILLFAAEELGNVEQAVISIILNWLSQYRGITEILVGVSILILERWLGKNKKIEANSSLELLENTCKYIIKKKK